MEHHFSPGSHGSFTGGYSYVQRKKVSKTDWAGVGLGDAFKKNLDHYQRLPAQRLFYQTVKKVQAAVAGSTTSRGSEFTPKVKPQLSPCYTMYPSVPASHAAIGLTGFLEYKARVPELALPVQMADYLENPGGAENVKVNQVAWTRTANMVAECVQARLLLEELSRIPSAASVEIYRLFSASQLSLRFQSLPEIVRAVVLYGDILPDWETMNLHPWTASLLKELTECSQPHYDRVSSLASSHLLSLGKAWVKSICRRLLPHLPPPPDEVRQQEPGQSPSPQNSNSDNFRLGGPEENPAPSDKFSPLNDPAPPMLHEPANPMEKLAQAVGAGIVKAPVGDTKDTPEEGDAASAARKILEDFAKTVTETAGQQSNWEDMRSDLVEQAVAGTLFAKGPIEGNPSDGHTVIADLGEGKTGSGELFDRPVELSDDLPAYEQLLGEARPISEALRKALYPTLVQVPEIVRFRSSGALDPGRLALADVSPSVFRRYRIREQSDQRGKPILLIVCDGSGSLNPVQTRMLKVLAAAWLDSTSRSDVTMLAGLYNTSMVRSGVSGPLVQWIYHPRKSIATSSRDAIRALVALPDNGMGGQADALSLSFMLGEAFALARGRMVYLILITDCGWCKSFQTEGTALEEVQNMFRSSYGRHQDKLHSTLVSLGPEQTGFEDILDKVITVSTDQLDDYGALAQKIGTYVATCMKERRQLLTQPGGK